MRKMRQEDLFKQLNARVQEVQGEVEELQARNGELRLRLSTLQLAWRVLREVRAHRLAHGAACEQEDEQLRGLEELLQQTVDAGGGSEPGQGCGGGLPSVLDTLPHLAPGVSVLPLEGVKPDAQTQASATTSWAHLVHEALALGIGCSDHERAAQLHASAELRALGLEMKQIFLQGVRWNFSMYIQLCARDLETNSAVCGMHDAPLTQWERALRAARLTRLQARVIHDLTAEHLQRMDALGRERAALAAQLGAAAALAAGPFAAVAFAAGDVGEEQDEVVEALNANISRQQAAITFHAICVCGAVSEAQFATLFALAYPWPVNLCAIISMLQHDLKFNPEAFAEGP